MGIKDVLGWKSRNELEDRINYLEAQNRLLDTLLREKEIKESIIKEEIQKEVHSSHILKLIDLEKLPNLDVRMNLKNILHTPIEMAYQYEFRKFRATIIPTIANVIIRK